MGRKTIVEKNRVYVECTDAVRRVKGVVLTRSDTFLEVELPSGFVMELTKKHQKGVYTYHLGMLEFISDGKPVV